eukprot:COSAG03_NODE_5647_length_1203_cov_1.068841_1_plen_279_part_00
MGGAGSAHLWLALLVLGAPPQQAQELVRDGDFATHSNKVTAGQYMSEFPGFKNTALAVFPGSSPIVVLSDAAVKASRGWYRVRFFAHALHGYGAVPLTVDVLGADGAALAPPFRIALRAARNEWLHYDEYVPCNPPVTTKARLTIPSGQSTLQLTGLSITWEEFSARALEPVLWLAAGTLSLCLAVCLCFCVSISPNVSVFLRLSVSISPRDTMLLLMQGPAQPSCPINAGGSTIECPHDFGESSLSRGAFDNDHQTNWLIAGLSLSLSRARARARAR